MTKLIYILLFIATTNLYSQGFDWQVSPRYPIEMPNYFFGIGLDYSFAENNGKFNLIENKIPCCQFNSGNGNRYSLALYYENWLNGTNSYNISVSYNYLASKFEIQDNLPTREGEFKTMYSLESKMSFVGINGFYKIRVPKYGINFSTGLNLLFNISSTQIHKEYAISNNVPFKERTLSNGQIESTSLVVVEPFVQVGTDLDLGIGMYASPNIKLGYSLNSYLTNDSWRSLIIGFNLRIYRSFDF